MREHATRWPRPPTIRGLTPSAASEPQTKGAGHERAYHLRGHPSRLNRPTLVNHDGFGSESYAREELRAEIAAMMTGEQLGVGHEPRHGTAYVSSWITALENNPKEIRAAAVDAQRITDWLLARERERSRLDDKAAHDRPDSDAGQTREPRDPDRPCTKSPGWTTETCTYSSRTDRIVTCVQVEAAVPPC